MVGGGLVTVVGDGLAACMAISKPSKMATLPITASATARE